MGQRFSLPARLGAVIATALLLAAPAVAAHAPLTVGDVVLLLEAGVGHDVILTQGSLAGFASPLSVEDILRLRRAGADDTLLRSLQEAGRQGHELSPVTETASDEGVRIFRTRGDDGREVLVLTNLDETGRPLASGREPVAGVISASDRGPAPGTSREAGAAAHVPPSAATLLPPTVEVVVRRDPAGEEARLGDMEERVARLERMDSQERPPVGAGGPRHPINDHRDYPILTFPFLPVLTPIAVEPQEFRVRRFGPFLSFTGARAAGVDPFRAPGPCQPGQACSIEQRLSSR